MKNRHNQNVYGEEMNMEILLEKNELMGTTITAPNKEIENIKLMEVHFPKTSISKLNNLMSYGIKPEYQHLTADFVLDSKEFSKLRTVSEKGWCLEIDGVGLTQAGKKDEWIGERVHISKAEIHFNPNSVDISKKIITICSVDIYVLALGRVTAEKTDEEYD